MFLATHMAFAMIKIGTRTQSAHNAFKRGKLEGAARGRLG